MQKFYAPYFKEYSKEDLADMKSKGIVAGYYLVIPSEGSKSPSKRFFHQQGSRPTGSRRTLL